MIPLAAFRLGMNQVDLKDGRSFLIATPEKALADKIRDDRGNGLQTRNQLLDYLQNNLRVDMSILSSLDSEQIGSIANRYRSRKIRLLGDLVRHLKRNPQAEVGHA